MKYDYLIVGSGLFGSTFAYRATQRGRRCVIIDKRPQLGGNLYCEHIEGINVHKYGAHIFHTSNKEVWDFVNSFVDFNEYKNSPIANYKGKLYNLPFNMNTFHQIWGVTTPAEAYARIEEEKKKALKKLEIKDKDGTTAYREPANLEEQALKLVGRDIYEKLIKEYTEKQWGRKCSELPAFIIKRLPVRLVFDNNYFDDTYQGIPIGGYNKLINGMLRDVDCFTNIDFFSKNTDLPLPGGAAAPLKDHWRDIADKLVYTGALDEYFGYSLGRLEWRTLKFKTRTLDLPNFQGNAVMNFTSHDVPYTRIIEHKHFETFGEKVYDNPKTVISEEYSAEYKENDEPYYPVNDTKNNALADKYREMAAAEQDVIFGGRLAQYRYYDMAPIIEEVMKIK